METNNSRPRPSSAPRLKGVVLLTAALATATVLTSANYAEIVSAASVSAIEIEPAVTASLSTHGFADVFIHLDVPPNTHAAIADAAIARAQASVVDYLGLGFEVTNRYAHIPALAGRLSPSSLDRIELAPFDRLPFDSVPIDALPIDSIALDPEIVPYDLDLDTSVRFIGGDKVRRDGHSGRNVNVAVMDTGVDTRNLDLADAIVAQLCTLEPASRCGTEDHPADDTDGHGTHVAGIVASRGKRGGFGVAPDAGIIAVKFLETRGVGVGSDFVGALDLLLARDDVHLINMSLGYGTNYDGDCDDVDAFTRSLSAAFDRLRSAGVVSVAASGNDGTRNGMGAPACIASVVSVGAVDHTTREIASFTNRSSTLDLLAPGVAIVATSIRGGTSTKSGTSMAAPHVAGAMAVLKGAAPWADPDQLEQVLKDHGQRPTIRIGDNEITTIKLDKALDALLAMAPTVTPFGPTATATSGPTGTPIAEPTDPSPTPTATPPAPTETQVPPVGTRTSTPEPPDPTPAEPSATPLPGGVKVYLPTAAKS